MNPSNLHHTPASALNPESLQKIAHWLKRQPLPAAIASSRRQVLAERYPQGLLSDDELDALLAALAMR